MRMRLPLNESTHSSRINHLHFMNMFKTVGGGTILTSSHATPKNLCWTSNDVSCCVQHYCLSDWFTRLCPTLLFIRLIYQALSNIIIHQTDFPGFVQHYYSSDWFTRLCPILLFIRLIYQAVSNINVRQTFTRLCPILMFVRHFPGFVQYYYSSDWFTRLCPILLFIRLVDVSMECLRFSDMRGGNQTWQCSEWSITSVHHCPRPIPLTKLLTPELTEWATASE